MRLPWLIHGYEGAVDRLSLAMDLPQETARDVSIAAFEAANWLAVIAAREQITDDRRLKALLFARNRLQHHWSAGMYFDQASRTWLWYPAGNIRVPEEVRYRDQEGARAYEEFLATRPVLEAFGYVRDELRRRWPDDN